MFLVVAHRIVPDSLRPMVADSPLFGSVLLLSRRLVEETTQQSGVAKVTARLLGCTASTGSAGVTVLFGASVAGLCPSELGQFSPLSVNRVLAPEPLQSVPVRLLGLMKLTLPGPAK